MKHPCRFQKGARCLLDVGSGCNVFLAKTWQAWKQGFSVFSLRGCFTKPKSAHSNEQIPALPTCPESNQNVETFIPISNAPQHKLCGYTWITRFHPKNWAFANSTFQKKSTISLLCNSRCLLSFSLNQSCLSVHAWVDFTIQEALQGAQ